jgi:hypothetical protein
VPRLDPAPWWWSPIAAVTMRVVRGGRGPGGRRARAARPRRARRAGRHRAGGRTARPRRGIDGAVRDRNAA